VILFIEIEKHLTAEASVIGPRSIAYLESLTIANPPHQDGNKKERR